MLRPGDGATCREGLCGLRMGVYSGKQKLAIFFIQVTEKHFLSLTAASGPVAPRMASSTMVGALNFIIVTSSSVPN